MLTDTGLPKTITDIKSNIKSHISHYEEYVNRFNTQLDVIKSEFEKYPHFDKEQVENARFELDNILDDFDAFYVRPLDSDPGTKPFDYIKDLLPLIDQYL